MTEAELERLRRAMGEAQTVPWKTPDQGAATSVLLATYPQLAGIGGRYFEDCNDALSNEPGTRTGVAPWAVDPEAAARLLTVSEQMVD